MQRPRSGAAVWGRARCVPDNHEAPGSHCRSPQADRRKEARAHTAAKTAVYWRRNSALADESSILWFRRTCLGEIPDDACGGSLHHLLPSGAQPRGRRSALTCCARRGAVDAESPVRFSFPESTLAQRWDAPKNARFPYAAIPYEVRPTPLPAPPRRGAACHLLDFQRRHTRYGGDVF